MRHSSKTLEKLAHHPRVEIIDDERSVGNSIIITLRKGWTFGDGPDNRVTGADTVVQALEKVRAAKPYHGPFDP